MKDHHKDKAHVEHDGHHSKKSHPHHRGAGMPYFEKGHWEKKMEDVSVADGKYSSEMNQAEEYKESVDKLAAYAKKHKMKY